MFFPILEDVHSRLAAMRTILDGFGYSLFVACQPLTGGQSSWTYIESIFCPVQIFTIYENYVLMCLLILQAYGSSQL